MNVGRAVFRSSIVAMAMAYAAFPLETQEARSSNLKIENGVERIGPIMHPGATKPSFTLRISAKAAEFRVGSRVSIDVIMKNITKHTIDHSDWYSDAGEMSYLYDVRDEDGKPVEKIVD